MKLRILADGSTKWQRAMNQWGLSILIDDDILFDTFGKPDYVLKQLEKIGADIDKIKHIVISHDDWDHIAGLWKILEANKDVTVYICPNFKPEIKARIRERGARFVEVKSSLNIRDNVYSSGELTGSRRNQDVPEQYLGIRTPKGFVIVTGCAHPGIIEIVKHAKTFFDPCVTTVIGGFHLKDNTAEENGRIVLQLKELGILRVIPLHCTGPLAQELFQKEYKKDCAVLGEGQSAEI